jgi:DNA-binding MarR family transcriptional regulator
MLLEDEIRQKSFKNEQEKGIVNMIYTYNWMDSQMKVYFKNYDLTPQQFNILRILRGQYPKPCSVITLRERMLDKMSDASRIVERLRIKNLIIRNISQHDRRSVDIIISEAGLEKLESIDQNFDSVQKEVFSNLDKEEIKILNQLLDKMRGS